MTQIPVAIPELAPVMVLPGVVLFPKAVLPLRIFEPRYRAMLEYALENDRMFCVAQMKPGISDAVSEDEFFHTAGIGLIAASHTQADGTSNLMLHGLARVRFRGFVQERPFRIARVAALVPAEGDSEEAEKLATELRRLCAKIRVNGVPLPHPFPEMLAKITDPEDLANAIAHGLIGDGFERQAILEEEDTAVRLRMIVRLIREQFPAEGK
jgi:Lon protease-like protein